MILQTYRTWLGGKVSNFAPSKMVYNLGFKNRAHPTNPVGGAVLMLTQKHVAKRYMIAKKVVPLHYESEWQYKYV